MKCGVAAVDLRGGRGVSLPEFQRAVEETFEVQLVLGLRFPEVLGFQHDIIHHTFAVSPARPGG